MAAKKNTKPKIDPTSDEALRALDVAYASSPDLPVAIAIAEAASLARLAGARKDTFAKIGIPAERIELLATFSKRLAELEKGWRRARGSVRLSTDESALLTEAEALDTKLLAGGRWACRGDKAAQDELSRIAAGAGIADTVQDLRDLVDFWAEHKPERGKTDITAKDLERATGLAEALDDAAAMEESNVDAASAQELRNRCYWATDELAKEIREGGRYAFRAEPMTAAKFISRYRAAAARRSRRKAKAVAKAAAKAAAKAESPTTADKSAAPKPTATTTTKKAPAPKPAAPEKEDATPADA